MKKLNLKIKDMPYAAEEALNRLRVNIKFCGKNTKKIVITSSIPNEGKSTVSVRLWKLLSEAGFPTVLVDVDFREFFWLFVPLSVLFALIGAPLGAAGVVYARSAWAVRKR